MAGNGEKEGKRRYWNLYLTYYKAIINDIELTL